jgi:hypothetical protein
MAAHPGALSMRAGGVALRVAAGLAAALVAAIFAGAAHADIGPAVAGLTEGASSGEHPPATSLGGTVQDAVAALSGAAPAPSAPVAQAAAPVVQAAAPVVHAAAPAAAEVAATAQSTVAAATAPVAAAAATVIERLQPVTTTAGATVHAVAGAAGETLARPGRIVARAEGFLDPAVRRRPSTSTAAGDAPTTSSQPPGAPALAAPGSQGTPPPSSFSGDDDPARSAGPPTGDVRPGRALSRAVPVDRPGVPAPTTAGGVVPSFEPVLATPVRPAATAGGRLDRAAAPPWGAVDNSLRGALGNLSAGAGSATLLTLVAILAATFFLAAPRPGRRLRPGEDPWPLPVPPFAFERPG